MALFQYRAADYSGKVVEGVMDAEAEHRVVARLHDMGFVPLRIAASSEAAGRSGAAVSLFLQRKVSEKALLHFTQELSTLLGAGLPLDRSLSVLASLVEGPEFKKIVSRLLEEVRAGKALGSAMAEHSDVFPKLYVNMIRAGETGGVLDGVLRHLSEYLERSIALKEDIKSALTYPVVLAAVAGLSLIFLFVYVIPKFAFIFKDVKQGSIPFMAEMLIGFSAALSQYGWFALLFIIFGVAGFAFYIRSPEGRLQWDRWRLNAWLIGNLMRQIEVARFARTLGALLKGGVPLLDALGTVQGVVGNRLISRAIAQVQVRVREGKGMVGPLTESGLFPPLALHMIAVGQETGRLEGMLTNVAEHYDQEVKRATTRLTSMLEPIMIVGMGLIIGTVVVSMLTAIFSINDLPL